jgi:hypothetical protein
MSANVTSTSGFVSFLDKSVWKLVIPPCNGLQREPRPPIPTTLGTHLGGFFWGKEQAFISIGYLLENACSYQLEQQFSFTISFVSPLAQNTR